LDIVWENKPANYDKARALLDAANVPSGSLVILPEMFATGFSMNLDVVRERIPPQTESFLADNARQRGVFMLGGVANLGPDGRGRNQLVVFSPEGRSLARYCKMHPFTLGGEAQHYAAGTDIVTFHWQGLVVAPFICYDLRFPEIFRAAVRKGAQLFVVIANWPAVRAEHWRILLRARAIENQAYVAGVNRCGADPHHSYPGCSLIVDHLGQVMAEAGHEEGIIRAELDPTALAAWRSNFPALQDMRFAVEGLKS
jgi:predicted amidohydrolase